MAMDRGGERDVAHRMIEGYTAWGELKSVLSKRGLGINAKECPYAVFMNFCGSVTNG